MKIYAVIDTNVLVSAMLSRYSDSATVKVVDLLLSERVVPVFNDEILSEYHEVLHRRKFNLPDALIGSVLMEIKSKGISMDRVHSSEVLPDQKDVVFYEVALSKAGTFLVTGNIKHFPVSPMVVTPSQFLQLLHERF